ncbi:S27A6 protein, partial [Atractosteus spatula]|nr:S27A6 protein [Atractosteus spatula]
RKTMLQALLWTAAAVLGALYTAVRWICPYFWDDVKFCIRSMCIEQRMQYLLNSGTVSLVNIFMEQALEKPDKPFVIYEEYVYTYQDVDKRSNKVAYVFLKEERLAKGDVVALLMNNEPEYISTWFGLRKMGFTVAMLNVNIKAKSLEHCVLKKKFSVSQFWSDCRKYDVSMLTYVGEICRYLCSAPKVKFKQGMEMLRRNSVHCIKAGEKNHKVRLATGVGLRHDVWKDFAECFGVYGITESYGSTESNVSFINYTGKIGAIGRAGFLNKLMFPFEFLKYDVLKEEVVRDETGRCFKAKKGEVGLLVCQVTNQNPFCGYAGSVEQTQKKLLRNVLKEGDVYYNSGDLMKVDKDGFVYFCDRVGDTFRWKGENVSTTEVAEDTMNITETFKYKKVHLVKEGFNPSAIADPLYVLDCSSKTYKPLTKEMYEDIISGKLQL